MEKVKKIFKTLFWVIWGGILIFLHIGVIGGAEFKSKTSVIMGIVCISLWWVLTIGASSIKDKIQKKKYREQYISTITLETAQFGTMTFENDSRYDEMASVNMNLPKFGSKSPEELIINDYKEKDKDLLFRGLETAYEEKERILEYSYKAVKDFCDDYEEQDEDGNSISEEDIRENAYIGYITLSKRAEDEVEISMEVYGFEADLGGHGVVVYMSSKTKELSVSLEG